MSEFSETSAVILSSCTHSQREKHPQKVQATEERALQTKGAETRARYRKFNNLHVLVGIHPCVIITNLRDKMHVEAEEKPSKKSKKGGAKGSISFFVEGIYTIGLCISRFQSEEVYST